MKRWKPNKAFIFFCNSDEKDADRGKKPEILSDSGADIFDRRHLLCYTEINNQGYFHHMVFSG